MLFPINSLLIMNIINSFFNTSFLTFKLKATLAISIILLVCLVPSLVFAQDVNNLKNHLKETQAQISTHKKNLTKLKQEQRLNAREIYNTKVRVANTQKQIDIRYQRLSAIQEELTYINENIASEKLLLKDLLVGTYILSTDGPFRLLLNNQSPDTSSRYLKYYQTLHEQKVHHIEELAKFMDSKEILEEKLTTEVTTLRSLKISLDKDLDKLELTSSNQNKKLSDLSKNINNIKEEQNKVKKALKNLEEKIAKQKIAIKEAKNKKRKQELAYAKKEATTKGLNQKHLEANIRKKHQATTFKGLTKKHKLSWPIAGKVIKNFGQRRTGEISWKGLLISQKSSTEIKAIASGDILYSGYLNGFGNIIVIDHGKDYISLYGNNSKNLVNTGATIAEGDIIGFTGNSGDLGKNSLYFEIRYQGHPQNPRNYLK